MPVQPKTVVKFTVRGGERQCWNGPVFHDFGLVYLAPNKDSYFSAVFWDENVNRRYIEALGTKLFNQAKALLEPLHLCDSTGVPMYTVENGFYYVEIARGCAKWHTPDVNDEAKYTAILAEHLRIDIDHAKAIVADKSIDKDAFSRICDAQRERWQQEADKAIEFLRSIQGLSV